MTESSTKAYEQVYDLFISGRFEEALNQKRIADSVYKTNYWQPQLLYIESVYHIRQRQDSIAKNVLQTLIAQGPNTPLAAKAQNMIDVLNRRAQIEEELTRLQIQRPPEDSLIAEPIIQKPVTLPINRDTAAVKPNVVTNNPPKKDSLQIPPPRKDSLITVPPAKKDTVAKIPPAKKDSVTKTPPVKKDTVAKTDVTKNIPKKDTASKTNIPKKDTATKKPVTPPKPASVYNADTTAKHYAVVILDQVDPLFVVEVKNAFFRYNRERHGHRPLELTVTQLDATKNLLLIGWFGGARDAADYLQVTKRYAPSEILPWLKADKYSFSILAEANLNMLLQRKDLQEYRKFLDQNLPVKF